MLNKKFIQKLKKDYQKQESERRQIIALANQVLHDSKRVIFSLHREEIKKAEESLKEIEKILINLEKKFTFRRILQEGSYKAGVEEYVEAKTFYLFLSNQKIDSIKNININFDSYLGGICDLTGELVRRAINQVAQKKFSEAEKINHVINDILAELIEFDFTGYLRTKYDQAKNNLKKIEQINYELQMKK